MASTQWHAHEFTGKFELLVATVRRLFPDFNYNRIMLPSHSIQKTFT